MASYLVDDSQPTAYITLQTDSVTGTVGTTPGMPTASFTSTPTFLSVAFNASASSDTDGTIVSYEWDFGDGSAVVTSGSPTTTHVYSAEGSYDVTLTVTDNASNTAQASDTVDVVAAVLGELYNDYAAAALDVATARSIPFIHLGNEIQAEVGPTWPSYIADEINPSALGHEFIAGKVSDAIFDETSTWEFTGPILLYGNVANFKVRVDTLSNLGTGIQLRITNLLNSAPVFGPVSLTSEGQVVNVGALSGNPYPDGRYRLTVTGTAVDTGVGEIELSLLDGTRVMDTIQDTINIV